MTSDSRSARPLANPLLTVLWFGALWGALEAVVGGALHMVLPPTVPGRVMLAVAFALMALAVERTGKPWMPAAMALVAAPLKLLSAWTFALPVVAPAVVNPAFAILAEGAAFSVAAYVLTRIVLPRPTRLATIGATAGALQVAAYVVLVRTAGLALYPPRPELQAIGAKFPAWALSADAAWAYVFAGLPLALLAGAVGGLLAGLLAGLLPQPREGAFRPALLYAGSAACLALAAFGTLILG
jgi:hypothetical protein